MLLKCYVNRTNYDELLSRIDDILAETSNRRGIASTQPSGVDATSYIYVVVANSIGSGCAIFFVYHLETN